MDGLQVANFRPDKILLFSYVKKLSKAEWAGVPEHIHMLKLSGTI